MNPTMSVFARGGAMLMALLLALGIVVGAFHVHHEREGKHECAVCALAHVVADDPSALAPRLVVRTIRVAVLVPATVGLVSIPRVSAGSRAPPQG